MKQPFHSAGVSSSPSGFALDEGYDVAYAYDMSGRFHRVSSSVQSLSSVAAYSYLDDTDLISGMTSSSGFLWVRAYESARSLIAAVENRYGETVVSRYDYANDEIGRRTSISRSGQAFGDMPVRDAYGYNDRSEVTSARRTPVGSQTELRGFSYDYDYDPIGNRITSTEYDHAGNALESEYTANALNQYGQRTVPGYAGVRGEADTNATVTVNADPAWRWGEYFYGGDEADNSADAVMKELEITATYSNLFTSVTGRVFVAETPESFQYDDDGNLTQDRRFTYDWDAENRLVGVTTRDDLPTGVPRVKVEYAYDHQGRRIAFGTSIWTNDTWQAAESRSFLYDGWNVVAEQVGRTVPGEPSIVATNLYTWGLDLSGSRQGAGGIGGLLAASLNDSTALYCFDANGNVGQLVSTAGDLLAHYEYSPFGETVVSTGPLAKANPFRFSTKWFDDATGLGYWGHRWYSPGMGRWLSRDPIGQNGGQNLYLYVHNSVANQIDSLGLKPALSCSINNIDPGMCGKITLDASFSLIGVDAGGLEATGTIIQNMTTELHVFDCITKTDVTSHFVDGSNQKYAETLKLGNQDSWGTTAEALDTGAYPCGTYGYGKWYGIAQYYEKYNASYKNDPWGINWEYGTEGQPWGNLLGIWGNVIIPPELAIPNADGIKRMFNFNWNCCGKERPNEYSYLSISTTSQK